MRTVVLSLCLAGCGPASFTQVDVFLPSEDAGGHFGVVAPEADASPVPDTPVAPQEDAGTPVVAVDAASPVDAGADSADAPSDAPTALLYDGSDPHCFYKYGAVACGWSWCVPVTAETDAASVPTCSGVERGMGAGLGEPPILCCLESDAGEGGASP